MKVAIIGGTGKIGLGIAKHLAKSNVVVIGSRDPARAEAAAKGIPGARGAGYSEAAKEGEAAVIALPHHSIRAAASLAGELTGKLVLSVVNPLKFEGGLAHFSLEKGSAAQELASMLPKSRVATAFNNIPAGLLAKDVVPPIDVLVAADSKQTFEEAADLIGGIPNVRPLYVGPLTLAGDVERLTAIVLNLARLNETGSLATKFVR